MKNKILHLGALALIFGGASAFADPLATLMVVENLGNNSRIVLPKDGPPAPPAGPVACDSTARSACSNGADSYVFNGCSVDSGKAVLTGGFDEVFTGTGAATCASPISDGETVVRTSKGLTSTYASGQSATGDTLGGTAYDGTVIPATGVTSTHTNGVLIVNDSGSHMVMSGQNGAAAEECYAISTAPTNIAGQPGDGSLVITDGAMRIFHQTDKYTSDVTVAAVAWSDKTCCHPVSGTITEVMTGSKTGTNTLTFTSTCGTATLVAADGTTSTVTMPACQ